MAAKVFAAALLAATAAGCLTVERNLVVEAARPWEGRYSSTEEFRAAAQSVSVPEGDCLWLLSGSTLKRLLKNTEAK